MDMVLRGSAGTCGQISSLGTIRDEILALESDKNERR